MPQPSTPTRRTALEKKLASYRARARWAKAAAPVLGVAVAAMPVVDVAAQGCAGTLSNNICTVTFNTTINASNQFFAADFDGDAVPEFYMFAGGNFASAYFFTTGSDRAVGFHTDDNNTNGIAYVQPLEAGENVAGLSFYQTMLTTAAVYLSSGGNGPWPTGQEKYAAMRLQLDGTQFYYGWLRIQNNGGGSFTIVDGAFNTVEDVTILTGDDGSGLPVELATFTAQLDGGAVHLNWKTMSETNNAGFELQHRQRDVVGGWLPVTFVEGQGTTTEAHTYQHRLGGLEPGLHVFRLKQVDLDGSMVYSPEVEVEVGVADTYMLGDAYPNPFNPQARFTLAVGETQQVRVALYDMLGREVAMLHNGTLTGGTTHRFVIDGVDLPSGTYLYRATGEQFAASKQVTLLK